MKYLVISDTHLTAQFDERKFRFIADAIAKADRVVINGDFWESEDNITTFDSFVTSEWSTKLFPLLKEKHTVYIYGNHDPKEKSDKRVNLFSDTQSDVFEFTVGEGSEKKLFRCEHGHKYVPLEGVPYPFLTRQQCFSLSCYIHNTVIGLFTPRIMNIMLSHLNKEMYKQTRSVVKKDQFFICGHTHVPEINIEKKFINEGFVQAGWGHCVLIDEKNITFIQKKL